MLFFNMFSSAESKRTKSCDHEFKQIWSDFVDTFIDSMQAQGPTVPAPKQKPGELVMNIGAQPRLVALGDLHGDLQKTKRAFRLANLIDQKDNWSGGTTTCVQVGDMLDRGDEEIQLLYFLEKLSKQAQLAGGALHILNGNHETMNIAKNCKYATQKGAEEFQRWRVLQQLGQQLKQQCECEVGARDPGEDPDLETTKPQLIARNAALNPGGPITNRFFARYPLILQVGSTVFVHGGILPRHIEHGLNEINEECQQWMLQSEPKNLEEDDEKQKHKSSRMPWFLRSREAVVWTREYSNEKESSCDCETLSNVLKSIPGAKRMVVGHTIQRRGINSACDGQVYRVDVGLSKGCGDGEPQVLQILDDQHVEYIKESQNQQQSQDYVYVEKWYAYFGQWQTMFYDVLSGMGQTAQAEREHK